MNFGERVKTTEGMTLIAAVDQGPRAPDYCAHGHPHQIELHRAIAHVSCIRLIPSSLRAFAAPAADNLSASQFPEIEKTVKASAG